MCWIFIANFNMLNASMRLPLFWNSSRQFPRSMKKHRDIVTENCKRGGGGVWNQCLNLLEMPFHLIQQSKNMHSLDLIRRKAAISDFFVPIATVSDFCHFSDLVDQLFLAVSSFSFLQFSLILFFRIFCVFLSR